LLAPQLLAGPPELLKVYLIVSIDPEQDTPARLAEYAKRFRAGPQWQFYTGTASASVATQQAFGVYRGDKMNHEPLTFLRPAPGLTWLRIDGLASPGDLAKQVQLLVAGK
jgi:protein SCO1/2